MYDTFWALGNLGQPRFLSRRISKLPADIPNQQPKTGRLLNVPFYHPWHLWRLLGSNTDILLLKHLNDPINFIPYLLAYLKGTAVICLTQQPRHPTWPGYKLLWALARSALKLSHIGVLATTKEGHREALSLGLPTVYAPACLNPDRIKPATYSTPDPHTLRLLTISKYQPRKNLVPLISAIATLKKKFPQHTFQLTIVGALSDRQEAQQAWHNVQQAIQKYGVNSEVSVHNNVPYQNITNYLHATDLFVLPASREPLGYATVEAMAAGLPIISNIDVGSASYIRDHANGYVIPLPSAGALAVAISHFVDQPSINHPKLRKYGAASRKYIEQHHRPDQVVSAVQQLYTAITN